MICLIIFVFDPLAVALTLAANIAMTKKPIVNTVEVPTSPIAPSPPPNRLVLSREVADSILRSSRTTNHNDHTSPIQHELAFDGVSNVSHTELSQLQENVRALTEEHSALEHELSHKQDMIEQLSEDNGRLEQELFKLAEAYERKEQTIAQLKDALKILEQQAIPLTIEERAALHTRNQTSAKS